MTNRAIVITTINKPTQALEELGRLDPSWPLIVIGDNKTPSDWEHPGARFVSIAEQRDLAFRLAPLLPENHYCRKNIGYLIAMEDRVEILGETDDDNVPAEWPLESLSQKVAGDLVTYDGWVNVYRYFTEDRIWPRGFPLEHLAAAEDAPATVSAEWRSSVQQYLAAGDPDVDAIYRLTVGRDDHTFADRTVGLDIGSAVPFNSQSTVWFPEAFAYLYLPSYVSFRMTDIWRSFVAQACLWAVDDRLTYHGKGVRQVRNDHDLKKDFEDEIIGYQRNDEIMQRLRGLSLSSDVTDSTKNLITCYRELNAIGVIPDRELPLVEAWALDVDQLTQG